MDRRQATFAALAASLLPAAARAAPEPADVSTFTSGGVPVGIEWFAAAGNGRAPAVLLLHGSDGLSYGEWYRTAARALAAAGYGVGLPHYFERTKSKAITFDRIRPNYMPWLATCRDAVGWLAGRPDVDPDRIGIVGASLGAALAIDTAGAEPRIRALVDYFGPMLEGVYGRVKRLPPTLVLHGERDGIVGIEHARAMEAFLKRLKTPYEIKIYPDQGHGFIGAAQLDAATRVTAFLGRNLTARRAG